MGGYQVTPEDLHATAGSLEAAGGDLHAQWEQLKADTLAIRFGTTDTVGPLIQMTMEAAVMIADDCFGSSHEGLGNHAEGLRRMATAYSQTEDTNQQLLK